ncbi:MAG TPA: signal peptidase I [Gammaproteobacteria bacterium]|nr:signal peptidase I [Gammaproteobacteria bacterium]
MDFAFILFIALVVTGGIWLLDKVWLAKRRHERIQPDVEGQGSTHHRDPLIIEYAKAFFPVILIVFVLRSFVAEPFRIPSGSMLPTLNIGDFILVNKFSYGLRLPVANVKLVGLDDPARGDVMVFRFPHDPKMHFVKRVVGIPGDTVETRAGELYINGDLMKQTPDGQYEFKNGFKRNVKLDKLTEDLDGIEHNILLDRTRRSQNMKQVVPEGQYFVMGDNRNYSNDSRYWGFVPDKNVVGKAFFIWFAWDAANGGGVNWSRIGTTF